jgi:iron complex outermembrane receptor protein
MDLGADYRFEDVFGGAVKLSINYQYDSGFFFEADNVVRQPSFSEVGASAKWISEDGRYSVKVWGNNLNNAVVGDFVATETFGAHVIGYTPPRTFGGTLGYAF